ncbi:MAG TPA: murein L,D-transpeptidase catalytic domain family protein [Vicinamibacterales bacterium]|nr:murein L,D-transpeptidase catalytic domain family protein [Vicinamibacterales bacterium]
MLRLPILGAALVAATLLVPNAVAASTSAGLTVGDFDSTSIGNIETDVLEMALNAASCAVQSGAVNSPKTLTVIDYSKPSSERRLWVFDLKSKELVYEELVAHGQGSGANLATQFSNEDESHQTSLGLFVTRDTYVGKNGYSLRLDGLDRGVNDRARDRAIVMHGAPYVSQEFVKANGRLGRSWGCPAISAAVAKKMIDRVKGGGLVFAYYPDKKWLKTSKYLGSCRA